jgi:hypothetical protein
MATWVHLTHVLRGCMGVLGYSIRNQEGEDVLSFALAYDMIVANTLFKKKRITSSDFS